MLIPSYPSPILTGLFSGVKDVGVSGALDDLVTRGSLQGYLEGHDLEGAGSTDL